MTQRGKQHFAVKVAMDVGSELTLHVAKTRHPHKMHHGTHVYVCVCGSKTLSAIALTEHTLLRTFHNHRTKHGEA